MARTCLQIPHRAHLPGLASENDIGPNAFAQTAHYGFAIAPTLLNCNARQARIANSLSELLVNSSAVRSTIPPPDNFHGAFHLRLDHVGGAVD